MTGKYFYYKCYYTNGLWDIARSKEFFNNPKRVSENCYKIEIISGLKVHLTIIQFDIEYYYSRIKNFFKRGIR